MAQVLPFLRLLLTRVSGLNVGFGFAPTLVGAELGNKHSALLQDALMRCVKDKQKKQH
jgi:hypothetical protein